MKIVVAAAGTGGHINPALAITNKICEENPDTDVVFFGTDRGLENDLIPRAGYKLEHIEAYGFKKELSINNIKNIIKTLSSKRKVIKFLKEYKPDLILGTGGYICVPVIGAGVKLGIPTALHESNAFPGLAVKMFSKKADLIMLGFEKTKDYLIGCKKIVYTGTPTKIKKVDISNEEKKNILKNIGVESDLPIVLIFGGSQGAQAINEAVIGIIENKLNTKYQIIWATGPKQYDLIKEDLEKKSINIEEIPNVKILPYIYNMEEMINISDLLVCRSGAMTCTEISIVGKPAIFVPLPSRSANRQEDNARVLENLGSGKIILNNELTSNNLAEAIDEIIDKPDLLKQMGQNAMQIAPKDVENKIYDEVMSLLK